jgi:hypothetical protein
MSDRNITFIQNFVPPLEAGEYQVSVVQKLLNTKPQGEKDAINESYVNTANFAVTGQRFSLDPDGVDSVFPPGNSSGEYSNVLPHILLTRRTLLWERSPTLKPEGDPWLALLLFDANDPAPVLQTVQVGDLQRQPFAYKPGSNEKRDSNLPANAVSYVDGYQRLNPTFAPDFGENYSDRVQVIDVDCTLFSSIAPSLADLQWLGSARTVPSGKKAGADSEHPGTFSLAIGNRTPTPNTKCTVHLVSLEGMSLFLPVGADYEPAQFTLPSGGQATLIRLVSLYSWNFTSIDQTQSFEGLLTNLKVDVLQRKVDPMTPPPPGASPRSEAVVASAFNLGYTAVNHLTRQGDTTVSWYRGPFVPFPVPPTLFIPAPDPGTHLPSTIINTSDQLVRYDPDNGLMDITYAAAWELGRMLGLASKSYSIALSNWRRAGQQATVKTAMHEASVEAFGEALKLPPAGTRGALEIHQAMADFICTHLKQVFIREESK